MTIHSFFVHALTLKQNQEINSKLNNLSYFSDKWVNIAVVYEAKARLVYCLLWFDYLINFLTERYYIFMANTTLWFQLCSMYFMRRKKYAKETQGWMRIKTDDVMWKCIKVVKHFTDLQAYYYQ